MPGDVYYVTRIPSELEWQDVTVIAIVGIRADVAGDPVSGTPCCAGESRRRAEVRVDHGKSFEIWIGGRYVRSRSRNSFVSLISAISMLGIAIAVLVLIVVMSVVNGFERELQERLLAMTAHASIEDLDGKLTDCEALRDDGTAESHASRARRRMSMARRLLVVRQAVEWRRIARHRPGARRVGVRCRRRDAGGCAG